MLILAALALQISVISDRPPRRIAVTPEHLATAFRDPRAKSLFTRARQARLEQDSSLRNYDAILHQRLGVGVTVGENGRERAIFRQEIASRVQWQRGIGAYVDLTGARLGIPVAPASAERSALISDLANGDLGMVPYYPGQESLGLGSVVGTNEIDDRSVVNPLAEGAEAYYTYESGDSTSYVLGDGHMVQIRELKVRPRVPSWNLVVGSLQVDIGSGQIVAAIYRMSAAQDMFTSVTDMLDDTAKTARRAVGILKAVAPRIESNFTEMMIEYSLHEGRFWLPRSRTFKGTIRISSAMAPAVMEQSITYARVNGPDTLTPIVTNAKSFPVMPPDSLSRDAKRKWHDSVSSLSKQQDSTFKTLITSGACDSTGVRTRAVYHEREKLAVAIRHPCDIDKLINSPDISKSLFAPGDSLFTHKNLDELRSHAIGLGAQAAFNLLKPKRTWRYGLSMSRYNRVEAFSTGIGLDQQFGGGYIATTSARFGFGDHELNGELSLARTNSAKTISLGGYRRLASASDWGNPFSASASAGSLLYARDEGFYYRATGAEVTYEAGVVWKYSVRLFGEQEREAKQGTGFSLSGDFRPNIVATAVNSFGASLRVRRDFGSDPRGFRVFTDLRLEGAGGDSTYGRGAFDVTVAQGLFSNFVAALTLSGGSSVGGVPGQRLWYLGGRETIRGQRPDTAQSGNAFWMGRLEIGKELRVVRLSVFGDIGWVGNRTTKLNAIGRPMSGVGVGASVLDGLLRLDLSRGIYPRDKFRADFTLGGRW